MMARATRSTTADLKRKRSLEHVENVDNADNAPSKLIKTEEDDPKETEINCTSILPILESEDKQDLLSRVFHQDSLRSLLSTSTPVSTLRSAINHLRPISSSRARPSQTAAQQHHFCNLALLLIEQVSPSTTDRLKNTEIPAPSSPQRLRHPYALVQHLPSGDWWSSSTSSISDVASLQTGNAELVAILPSTSTENPLTTLGTYCSKPTAQKKLSLAPRRVSTGAFLDYGPYSSFAPSFDQDGEVVGKRELGSVLWYCHEKKRRLREAIRNDHSSAVASIVEATTEEQPVHQQEQESTDATLSDDELEVLLGPEEIHYIKAALKSLELEKLAQQLLERNQRALLRLEELQKQRLTKHPISTADEGSEEWDTAQAILDSLTLLTSLRPRSSSEDAPTILPPPSMLHKLHRTFAIEPSQAWSGTLPSGRTTALRDDSTVKIRAGTATPIPVTSNTSTITTPVPVPATNTYGNYAYAYGSQPAYRPQAASYTPYKTPQAAYYPNYGSQQQQGYYSQQSYATATSNQQPYAAAAGQQPYAGYSWYGQYASTLQGGAGSGRGTPQPTLPQAANILANYSNLFNATAAGVTSTPTALGARTPAVGNTVASAPSASGTVAYGQAGGIVPTLPLHLKNTPQVTTNGATAYQTQLGTPYQTQTQPAT